jgi:hypothetical protein
MGAGLLFGRRGLGCLVRGGQSRVDPPPRDLVLAGRRERRRILIALPKT